MNFIAIQRTYIIELKPFLYALFMKYMPTALQSRNNRSFRIIVFCFKRTQANGKISIGEFFYILRRELFYYFFIIHVFLRKQSSKKWYSTL